MTDLLPKDALQGRTIGLSASSSSDLSRLGLLDDHLRLALGEIARSAITLGGRLQYCGHLERSGYTTFLVEEVKRYSRSDAPLSVILAWSVHRGTSLSELRAAEQDLGLLGSIEYLDPTGAVVRKDEGRGEIPLETERDVEVASLTAMRTVAADAADARVLIGGKREGYRGAMPGVLEEALLALERQTPLFLAGGYGGATSELIRLVEPEALSWLPLDNEKAAVEGHARALERARGLLDGDGWDALSNGPEPDENRRLAATHRASEIASLVSLGIGRLGKHVI